jgi:hypothetical protein
MLWKPLLKSSSNEFRFLTESMLVAEVNVRCPPPLQELHCHPHGNCKRSSSKSHSLKARGQQQVDLRVSNESGHVNYNDIFSLEQAQAISKYK